VNRTANAIARVAAAGLLVLFACRPALSAAPAPSPEAPASADAAQSDKTRETWDVLLLQGKRVGYDCTTIRHQREAGRDVVRAENTSHLSLKRGGETSTQDIRAMSIETPEGKLLSFESEICMGPSPIRTIGKVQDGRLELETFSGNDATPKRSSIAWSADYGGPLALEQNLAHKPMQPGERRPLKVLMAGFDQVADVDLSAKGFEPTRMPDGIHDLLRIETVTRFVDGQKIEQTLWTDRTGEVLKSFSAAIGGMETIRVSKAEALAKADAAQLDLLPSMMVKVDRPLPHPRETKQVRYRVHLEGGDPAAMFVVGPTQAIKSIDAHTAEITVYAIRPGQSDGNRGAPADPPTDNDLRPNGFIQSDDPLIVADAKKADGDERDPWRVAVALEHFVNRDVTKKDFSQVFASAAEVARSHEGDCTEHAVFLAALARARGIPARVAIGLVYLEQTHSFFYHMWTEVYVQGRWIPIDGTLAQGGIAADHLKIAQSSLEAASAYSAFLPVAQVAGRLKIEIVDVE
jgi:hypothetical protein